MRSIHRLTCAAAAALTLPLLVPALAQAAPPATPHLGETEFTSEEEARGYTDADLPLRPVPPRKHELRGPSPGLRRLRSRSYLASERVGGALSGKVVYLSPGHGFTYGGGWGTQRGNTFGVNEDASNRDGIAEFLVPYLLNAGAQVMPVREIDANPNMVILDDSDGASSPERGVYTESGDLSVFSDSEAKGWGHPPLPLLDGVNPFELGGNRLLSTATSETARATFALNVPEAGHYYVYIAYSMFTARPSDAEVIVLHPGGQTTYLVDQRRHGGTWVLLGRFYFAAGTDAQRGAVVVTNRSQDAGSFASVDAVRIGGGMGLQDRGGGTSQVRRSDECSRYHAQLMGAPPSVYDSRDTDGSSDVTARSRLTDWLHAEGEEAVFLSHHTNAFKGAIRGTESYCYSDNGPNGSYAPDPRTIALDSHTFGKAVHEALIEDLRAGVDPAWNDRKFQSAYFGEINPGIQDEIPAMLTEIAFHDQPDDAALLRDAGFRRLVARALLKGIVRYFAARDGIDPRLLPEPPAAVAARGSGPGEVTVSWEPPPFGGLHGDAAATYRVYRSADGHAFDGGTDTTGATQLVLRDLTPGEVLFFRVTAVNDGGESLPSKTLAVAAGPSGAAPVLLVGGFDRLDAELNVPVSYPTLGTVGRLFLERMNDGAQLVPHGAALASYGTSFDSCAADAVDGGAVDLGSYRAVIWQAGRGATPARGLTAASRDALAAAGSAGVALLVSGATVARSLSGGAAEDQALLDTQLAARFVTATEPLREVQATDGELFADLAPWSLAGPGELPYDTGIPDVIDAEGGARAVAAYASGAGGAAVHGRDGNRCSLLLGFPLEAVRPPERIAELLAHALAACDVDPEQLDGGVSATDGGVQPTGDRGPAPSEGCDCAVTPASPPLLLLLLGAALLGVSIRRRSRR